MAARPINARWCASTFDARWNEHSIHDRTERSDMASRYTESTAKVIEPPGTTRRKSPGSGQVKRSVRRLESRAKVDGSAEYIHNLILPGMLYGKIARSSIPHGRILSIDVTAALAVEGVHAVITGEDVRRLIPDPYYGPAFHDQPILALEKVRYAGEPVFDEVAAAKADAPIVHDKLRPAATFADLKYLQGQSGTNVALSAHVRRGDLEKGFRESDHIFEQTFRNGKVIHAPL